MNLKRVGSMFAPSSAIKIAVNMRKKVLSVARDVYDFGPWSRTYTRGGLTAGATARGTAATSIASVYENMKLSKCHQTSSSSGPYWSR